MKPIKILLVADEADENQYIHDTLSQIHHKEYQIDWVKTIAEAREALFTNYYHVVLLDFDMDCRAGSRLIREIAQYDYHVPVILFTIHDDDQMRGEIESGAFCYLHKHRLDPMSLEESIYRARMWEHLRTMFSV